jgi:hypothetical protein
MPMKKDPENGGTDSDGSRSTEYCSYCYEGGAFSSPEINTPQEMQKFCIAKMKEMGTPGFIAWLFTQNIPRLRRWASK